MFLVFGGALLTLMAFWVVFRMFGSGQDRIQAGPVTEAAPELSPVTAGTVVVEADGRLGGMDDRLFPVGSFLGLYGGQVYICPGSAPQPAWVGEEGEIGADWTWLEATAERPARCRHNGPIGVSVIAAPGLLAIAGAKNAPAAQPTVTAVPTIPPVVKREEIETSDDSIISVARPAPMVVIGGELGVYRGRTVTCLADSHAMRTLTDDAWDFAHASDGGSPGACYRRHEGGVLTFDRTDRSDKRGCLGMSGAVGADAEMVELLMTTDPSELEDTERLEWRHSLLKGGGSTLFESCLMYWSEPAGAANSNKRNESYRSCITEWSSGASSLAFWRPMRLAEAERLLRKAYQELSRHERETLREILNEGHGAEPNDCQLYYPQLYTGRWTPLE